MASTNFDSSNKEDSTIDGDSSRNQSSSTIPNGGHEDIGMTSCSSAAMMEEEPPAKTRSLPQQEQKDIARSHSNDEEDVSTPSEAPTTKRPLHDEYLPTSSMTPAPVRASVEDGDPSNKRLKELIDTGPFSPSVVQMSSTVDSTTAAQNSSPVISRVMHEHNVAASTFMDEKQEEDPNQTTPVTSPVAVPKKSIPVAASLKDDEGNNEDVGVANVTSTDDVSRKYLHTSGSYSWGRDEDYENMPKTPLASSHPAGVMRRQSSASSYSDISSVGGSGSGMNSACSSAADLARTMSPVSGLYIPEVPPAPPSTPASTVETKAISVRDLGLATPLPYSAGFVQNTYHLEQQQLLADGLVTPARNTYHLEQQQLLADGLVTPAPTRPARASPAGGAASTTTTQSHPKNPHDSLDNDLSEWAVGERYELLRMLGRGSYGEVAQARDLFQGRKDALVAIKRIQSPFEVEMDAMRLYREIHILRRLRGHDCIIKLLDVVQPPSDDLEDFHDLYLVFEYVDTDLYKLIMSPQYLTTEHIQTFLYQLLNGLKYIHSASVIHRDLKPANILLNEDCSLKICDFGLARIVDTASVMQSSSSDQGIDRKEEQLQSPKSFADMMPAKAPLTRQLTKHVVTRWYRAPELILIQPYTTAVDIWSLGCIFAELLSMQEGNVPGYQDRRPLFPGGACYPLSGDADNAERADQLNVIFGVIGTPSKEDLDALGKANEYIKSMKETKPKPLQELFPAADPAAIDLLQKMLKFNPKDRCTADEALDHGFFTAIRRQDLEKSIERPLVSPDFLHQEIDIDILKRMAYNEVLWFRDHRPGKARPSELSNGENGTETCTTEPTESPN